MNFIRFICLLALTGLLYSANTLAAGQAFKCTAADGSISFWDTRPTSGCVSVEEVNTHVGRGKQAESQAEDGTSLNEGDKKVLEEREKQVEERKQAAKEKCDAVRSNIKVLTEKGRVKMKNPDGSTRVMTPEEHQNKLDELKKYLQEAC